MTRRPVKLWIVLLAVLAGGASVPTAASAQAVQAKLSYDYAAKPCLPFLPARLEVRNDSDQAFDLLEIRSAQGGPIIRQGFTLPPKSQAAVSLCLPTLAARESFAVRLGWSGQWTWRQTVAIEWPIEQADQARAAMIDADVYRRWDPTAPRWPQGHKQLLVIAMILAGLGLAGTFFFQRAAVRLPLAAGVLVLAGGICWAIVASVPLVYSPPGARGGSDGLLVTGALRHVQHTIATSEYRPVYRNPAQFRRDETLIEPGKLTVNLVPDEIRIFTRPDNGLSQGQ